jgi:hypothetical protein
MKKMMILTLCASLLLLAGLSSCNRELPSKVDDTDLPLRRDTLRTLMSLRKLQDYPHFSMTFCGDYDFENLLDEGAL